MNSDECMKVPTDGINTCQLEHFTEMALFTWKDAPNIISCLINFYGY